MKFSPWKIAGLCSFAALLAATPLLAGPMDFSEVSLLVRAHESENTIIGDVANRKLAHSLTPAQEALLKKQGASDSLVGALRKPAMVLDTNDATAYEARREQMRKNQKAPAGAADETAANSDAPAGLHVFEVAIGYPVNLSQWGGPDYELAFLPPARLDEGQDDAVLIDPIRTGTDVATYHGKGRAADGTTVFPYRNYVSSMSYSFTRGVRIDYRHPATIPGSPYILYPVYAAGGVSLYYIGGSSDSVKLAVRTSTAR
ncbi:MAG: hypothetical protein ACR2NX_08265 [Chthoniobacterales bacterium]